MFQFVIHKTIIFIRVILLLPVWLFLFTMSSTSQSNVVNDSVGADSVGTGTGASASSQQQQQRSGANASEQQQPIATGPAADLFQSVDELSQEPPGQQKSPGTQGAQDVINLAQQTPAIPGD